MGQARGYGLGGCIVFFFMSLLGHGGIGAHFPVIVLPEEGGEKVEFNQQYYYYDSINLNGENAANQFIVKYRKIMTADDLLVKFPQSLGAQVVRMMGPALPGAWVVRISSNLSPSTARQLMSTLEHDPEFEYAELDQWRRLPDHSTSHSEGRGEETTNNVAWNLDIPAYAPGGINLNPVPADVNGKGISVAVVDTGILPHPQLFPNLAKGYDFFATPAHTINSALDPGDGHKSTQCDSYSTENIDYPSSWHGTRVAGVIAASGQDATSHATMQGIAPHAKILPVRVLGPCGGRDSSIIDAIAWAVGMSMPNVPPNLDNKARIVTISFNGVGPCPRSYRQLMHMLRKNGDNVVVVAAAGDGKRNSRDYAPANCPGVISVAAHRHDGALASYSNYGAMVTLAAPGGEEGISDAPGIGSTANAGITEPQEGAHNYHIGAGTGMAAAHVSGVVALMLSANPDLTSAAIRELLIASARTPPGDCPGCSAGLLDAAAAVKAALTVRKKAQQ